MGHSRRRIRRVLLWVFLAGIACMIFFFSSQNGEDSSHLSRNVLKHVVAYLQPALEWVLGRGVSMATMERVVRKLAHFSEYTLLGFCLTLLLREYAWRFPRMFACFIGMGYAVTDELHQLLSKGRSASLRDVLIDSAGVLTGMVGASFLIGVYYLVTRKRKA